MTMNAYDRDLYACRPTPIAPRFVTKPSVNSSFITRPHRGR